MIGLNSSSFEARSGIEELLDASYRLTAGKRRVATLDAHSAGLVGRSAPKCPSVPCELAWNCRTDGGRNGPGADEAIGGRPHG
jgi:hypothetical protein